MTSRYCELVIHGPGGLTRGFLTGFARGRGHEEPLFDAEAEGFDCSTLGERLHDLVRPSAQRLHLVAPTGLVPILREAVAAAQAEDWDVEIARATAIGGARFAFRFSIYSREEGGRLQEQLANLPEGLQLAESTAIEEKVHPEATGIEMYSPVHEYTLTGNGGIEGDVAAIVELYRDLRDEPLVQADHLALVLAED